MTDLGSMWPVHQETTAGQMSTYCQNKRKQLTSFYHGVKYLNATG